MVLQPITYRGRVVAACTHRRFFLADYLEHRPPHDAELTFVVLMCAYAGAVLRAELPGPYADDEARRYARACLIPDELLERRALDVARAAMALHVPAEELRAARDEYRSLPHRP